VRPFVPFLVRDLIVVAIALLGVWIDGSLAPDGPAGIAFGVLVGALATWVGFLVHEWGHLVGTLVSGGQAHAPASLAAVFLFSFDVQTSTRRQFLAMSLGGSMATAAAVVPLALWIDTSRASGLVALVLSSIGIVVTIVRELPTTWSVARGGPLPTGGVYRGTPQQG